MIQIKADVDGPLRTVQDMIGQLHSLPHKLSVELDNWQAEDMHRRHPRSRRSRGRENTGRGRGRTTWMWPRGRHRILHKTRPYHFHKGHRRQQRTSHRPILRWSLYDQFRARMTSVFETVKWRSARAGDA